MMRLCLINSLYFVKKCCLPAFDQLTQLKLVLYDCYRWDFLTELLKKSPNLESLVIEHKEVRCIPTHAKLYHLPAMYCSHHLFSFRTRNVLKDYGEHDRYLRNVLYSEHWWRTPESVPICLISHLKTITLRGFEGYPHVKKVAKYLLKNGKVLTKMTVYNDELYKVLMLERGSRTCWVELV